MKIQNLVTFQYCGTKYIQQSGNFDHVLFQLFQSLAIENTKNHYFFYISYFEFTSGERQHALSYTIESLVCYLPITQEWIEMHLKKDESQIGSRWAPYAQIAEFECWSWLEYVN
jgi:hypothetical protein